MVGYIVWLLHAACGKGSDTGLNITLSESFTRIRPGGGSAFHMHAMDGDGSEVIHFDRTPPVRQVADLDRFLANKKHLLSVLVEVEPDGVMSTKASGVVEQADGYPVFRTDARMTVDERLAVYFSAFNEYRFCLIVDSARDTVNPALVHAVMSHTVPIYNGFFEISTMFSNGVAAWTEADFNFQVLVERILQLNKNIRFLWSYQQILQEVLWYRYNSPVAVREAYLTSRLLPALTNPLAIVGIYSAVKNHGLRDVIRRTWGRRLRDRGFEVLFFLSSVDGNVMGEPDEVFLPVADGYERNSIKGQLFLQWIAANRRNHQFLIKTDDDLYFRPDDLIAQLRSRIPVGYIWGFIDYISPVPKDPSSPFYNDKAVYPYPTFPTYPRGVVRVLSMDIVIALAEKGRKKELRYVFGDDPSLGVHLRQAVRDGHIPMITIDDFGSYTRFAMQPTCRPSWSSVKNGTWIVHHVNDTQIECMWRADLVGQDVCHCLDAN